jgi:hypothetical protein
MQSSKLYINKQNAADIHTWNACKSSQRGSVRNRMPVSLRGGGGELGNLKT